MRQFAQDAGVAHTGEGEDTLEYAMEEERKCCHYRHETKRTNLHEHRHGRVKQDSPLQKTACGNDTKDQTQTTMSHQILRNGHVSWASTDWPGRRFMVHWHILNSARAISIEGSVH